MKYANPCKNEYDDDVTDNMQNNSSLYVMFSMMFHEYAA